MPLRFRKSIKVAPGVKINLNKKSTSVTVGGKGVHHTISSTGRKTTTVGIPGTGLSYSQTSNPKIGKGQRKNTRNSVQYNTNTQHRKQTIVEREVLDENAVTTCPNCGAVVRGSTCPYCNTPLEVGTKIERIVEEETTDIPQFNPNQQYVSQKVPFRKKHPIIFWFCMLCIWPFALAYWFYKTDVIKLDKKYRLIIIAVFFVLMMIFGSSDSTTNSTGGSSQIEEKIENPLMGAKVLEKAISEDNTVEMSYIEFGEEDFNQLDDSQICEFAEGKVKESLDNGSAYFSIMFGENTGWVFDDYHSASYGELDEYGNVSIIKKKLSISEDNIITWAELSDEEIQKQVQEKEAEKARIEQERKEAEERERQEREARLNAETVYVSNNGIYHRNSSCSNMKHYIEMSRGDAIASGYRPCGKC